jgi:CheY-like chemotaxis protein
MPSILLIDDDDTLRLTLRRSLERAGYETHEADNGRTALNCLREAPVDLILTDILMPEMEGIELILSLRRSLPTLPIIAMSGGGRATPEGYLKLSQDSGATSILTKPFEIEQLLATVSALIGAPDRTGN